MPADKILFFIIIYGVGAAVLFFVSHTLIEAGAKIGDRGKRTATRLVVGLWIWAAIANIYALMIGTGFIWLLPSFAIPLVIGVALSFLDPVKEVLQSTSVTKLVAAQIYRIAGGVFLIAYYFTGTYISREFALNAGWGDVLTGMLAIPTALAAYYRIPLWRWAVVIWCVIGITDLIVAPISAQLYGSIRLDNFPLNTIPIFFGPPLGILLHLITLRALWLQYHVSQ